MATHRSTRQPRPVDDYKVGERLFDAFLGLAIGAPIAVVLWIATMFVVARL